MTDQLKSQASDWLTVDAEERDLRDKLSECRKRKKAAEGALLEYMTDSNVDCLATANGTIEHLKKKTKQAINRKYLQNVLSEILAANPAEETASLVDAIESRRTVKVVNALKRK